MTGATTQGRRDDGRIQRWCRALYARLGSRIVFAAIALGLVVAGLIGIGMAGVGAVYLDLDLAQTATIVAVGVPLTLAAVVASLWLSRDPLRTVLAWDGPGRTAERAPAVWNVQVQLPQQVCVRAVVAAAIAYVPFAAGMVALLDLPAWSFIALFAALLAGTYAGGVLIWFGSELVSRPMLEDVASFLPRDFEPEVRTWRLRTKALLPVPGVTLFSGVLVGTAYAVPAGHAGHLAIALGIASLVALLATAVFLVINRAVLDPVDELLKATRRVRAGETATRVPVVTADDLGELAASFNGMVDDLQESRARIVAASDAGRRKVERDLHDGAQQQLVMAKLKLGWARGMLERDPAKAAEVLGQLSDDLDTALAQLRDLAHGIYPAVLENEGLPAALRAAAARNAIPTQAQTNGSGRYPPEIEAAVYFCCLEALQNASKYAGQGARALVTLGEHDGMLTFSVTDDGQGFPLNGSRSRRGLQNMADRLGSLGGSLDVTSAPGAGTTVSGTVPLARR